MMDDRDYNHLVWQCRRGTRELDKMVTYYLYRHYPQAGRSRQQAFRELLKLPDPVLYQVIMGMPEIPDLQAAWQEIAGIIRTGLPVEVSVGDGRSRPPAESSLKK